MTRKRLRMIYVFVGLALLSIAAALVLYGLRGGISLFFGPTELIAKAGKAEMVGRDIHLGGLVENGSVVKESDGVTTRFRVTDLKKSVEVAYKGVLPDLFREGQGVVVEGTLLPDGSFHANEVLAKHDEKYMPPEVAKALKANGEWRPEAQGQQQPASSSP